MLEDEPSRPELIIIQRSADERSAPLQLLALAYVGVISWLVYWIVYHHKWPVSAVQGLAIAVTAVLAAAIALAMSGRMEIRLDPVSRTYTLVSGPRFRERFRRGPVSDITAVVIEERVTTSRAGVHIRFVLGIEWKSETQRDTMIGEIKDDCVNPLRDAITEQLGIRVIWHGSASGYDY